MEVDQAMRAYYERDEEADRLDGGMESGPLEFERSKELIGRFLPERSLDVVDVGGGSGKYAAWLADLGHRVQLVDPIHLHVQQATAAHERVTAETGDARRLSRNDVSADVVLLLGPLYHLPERRERLRRWPSEARAEKRRSSLRRNNLSLRRSARPAGELGQAPRAGGVRDG